MYFSVLYQFWLAIDEVEIVVFEKSYLFTHLHQFQPLYVLCYNFLYTTYGLWYNSYMHYMEQPYVSVV